MDYPIYFSRAPKTSISEKRLYDFVPKFLKPKIGTGNSLHTAIVKQDYKTVKLLLMRGTDPRERLMVLFLTGPDNNLDSAKVVFDIDSFQLAQITGNKEIEILVRKYMKPWWMFW